MSAALRALAPVFDVKQNHGIPVQQGATGALGIRILNPYP